MSTINRMTTDLSERHEPVGTLFSGPETTVEREQFGLSAEQVEFYHESGYVAGVNILDDVQVDALCEELQALFDPRHPAAELWYEFNSNESTDPTRVLFHALGAWRISPGFHDILWHRAFAVPARSATRPRRETTRASRPPIRSNGIRTTVRQLRRRVKRRRRQKGNPCFEYRSRLAPRDEPRTIR